VVIVKYKKKLSESQYLFQSVHKKKKKKEKEFKFV